MSVTSTSPRERTLARLRVVRDAVGSAGRALMTWRGKPIQVNEAARGQLKTPIDQAVETLVVATLAAAYPGERILSEEAFERAQTSWQPSQAYWIIDALDGTRSFVEGFEGFCVQVAYVEDAAVHLAVIHEPVRQATYWAVAGEGAFHEGPGHAPRRVSVSPDSLWPPQPVFIDSTRPSGPVGEVMRRLNGQFLECGSMGLKLCRVADGSAHVFAKTLTFALWDVAPGDLILREAGGRVGLWNGDAIVYDQPEVYFTNVLAAPMGLFEDLVGRLSGEGRTSPIVR